VGEKPKHDTDCHTAQSDGVGRCSRRPTARAARSPQAKGQAKRAGDRPDAIRNRAALPRSSRDLECTGTRTPKVRSSEGLAPTRRADVRENSIVASISRLARERGYWVLKIAGGHFQRPGLPDLLCLKKGRAIFLEVKRPGCFATPLQQAVMAEIERYGGAACHVVTSREQADFFL